MLSAGMATGGAIGTRCISRCWLRMDWRREPGGAACPGLRVQFGGGKLARLFGQSEMPLRELGCLG